MFLKIFACTLPALVLYYVVIYIMDVMKAKAAAETNNETEELEIDITEEAELFVPTEVSRLNNDNQSREELHHEFGGYENEEEDSFDNESEDESVDEDDSLPIPTVEEFIATVGHIPQEVRQHHPNNDIFGPQKEIRKPIMLDGMDIDEFENEVEIISQKGKSDWGDIICELYNAA